METQLQEKNPNRLKKYIAIVGGIFTCAFAVFGALVSIKPLVKADALQYDFDNAVVLTADEVNNIAFKEVGTKLANSNEWTNDNTYLHNNYYIEYNNFRYELDETPGGSVEYISFNYDADYIYFYVDNQNANFGLIKYMENDTTDITFDHNIYFHGTEIVKTFKKSTITLTPTQLNDTTYSYLSEQIEDNYTNQLVNSVIEYNGHNYIFEQNDQANNLLIWNYNINDTTANEEYYDIRYNYEDNKFIHKYYKYNEEPFEEIDENLTFIDSITIFNASYIVDNINAPLDTGNFITDLIALLTGGIVPTASAMGTGVSGLVDALAIQGSTMSAFMSVVLIFGGIALALALCRWVVNLLSSLGQRNN